MTLVEVVVAIALFAVVSGSLLALVGGAIRLTRDDRFHMEATILASRELEITRDAFTSVVRGPTTIDTNEAVNPSPLAGGTVGQPLVVDNIPYTVTRTAQWSEMGTTVASTCDKGGSVELAYLRVKVEVTWPGLGDRPPVTMDTVMTPPKGTYSALTGHIGVKVLDASGTPFEGRTVTVTGTAGTWTESTASDGCALFAFLTPGTYQVKVQAAGYVNRSGDPSGTATAQVQSGQLWRTTIEYDQAATIAATFTTTSGYALPLATNTIPISLGNSALLPGGSKSVAGTGNSRTLTNLWPYPSGYQIWAGSCLDNDPEYTGQTRDLPLTTDPGSTVAAAIPLGAIDVQAAAGATITAVHASDSSCASGLTIPLGTATGGRLKTSVPFGTWTIKAGSATKSVTVASGDSPRSVTVP